MGLAASQGKMILLVQTRINQQYKLMDLSRKQMRLTDEQDILSDQFNLAKNQALYTYQYEDGTKAALTYSDLMGDGAKIAGRNPEIITDISDGGKVVLSSRYYNAFNEACQKNTSKDTAFNYFVNKLETSYSNVDWYQVLLDANKNSNTQTYQTPTYHTEKRETEASVKAHRDWETKCQNLDKAKQEFVAKFGATQPPATIEVTRQIDIYDPDPRTVDYDVQAYCQEYGNYEGFWYSMGGSNGYILTLHYIDTNPAAIAWDDGIQEYAAKYDLSFNELYDYVTKGTKPQEPARDYEDVRVADTNTTSGQSSVSTNSDSTLVKLANFYWSIFSNCYEKGCKTADDIINDRVALCAKLDNGTYLIDGNDIDKGPYATKTVVRDNTELYAQLKDDFDREMDKLERKEKKLTTEKESVQTRLTAIETEIQSVQSFIDKNIERSFNYCQNA